MEKIDIVKSIDEEIDEACEEKRPCNVEYLIRSNDVLLDKKANLDPEISGQIEWLNDSGTYKISVNKDHHYYRQRFTMAHEFGHFVFHRNLIGNGVDDTKAYRSDPKGRFHNKNIEAQHETEANKLAVYILMPTRLIRALAEDMNINLDNISDEDIQKLSTRLQVSKQALRYRLK